jgi:hypothetical protein
MALYRVFQLIDKLKELYRGETVWPYAALQAKWVHRTTDEIIDRTFEARGRTGQHLYCFLPEVIQRMIGNTGHDPYHRCMDRNAIEHWLTNHVFFDHYGQIVIFHDYGYVLWTAEDFTVDPKFELVYGKERLSNG